MNRYYWIGMTYVTRPTMWVIALLSVSTLGLALAAKSDFYSNLAESDQYSSIELPIITAGQPILDSRSALLDFADKPDRVQIRLDRVLSSDREELSKRKRNANPGQVVYISNEDLDVLSAEMEDVHFPKNVEAISMDGLGMKFLPRIGELESLKRLEFDSSYSNEKLDVASLSKLKHLEMLQLGINHQLDSLSPLGELPKLHTLGVKHVGIVTNERMAEVASFPSLKTLYLPDVSKHAFALAAIGELERSSSLKTVFVDTPLSEPDLLEKIQARVPNISVRSSRYHVYRLLLFGGAVLFTCLLSMTGLHIVSQFSMPQAQLVPGYRTAHLRFTWVLLGATVLVISGFVCLLGGTKLLPVLAALGCVTSSSLCSSSNPLANRYAKQSGLSVFFRLVRLGLVIGCIYWCIRQPTVLEEYLMGTMQWIAIVFLALAIVPAVVASQRLNGLARQRYAAGLPLTLSMQDLQNVLSDRAVAGKEGEEGKTDPHKPFKKVMPIGGVATIILVIARMWWGDQIFGSHGFGAMVQKQLVLFTVLLPVLAAFFIGAKWWQRMPYFATMITRPPSRMSHVNSILDGVRKDFAFQLGPVFIAILILAVTAPFWQTEDLVVRGIASVMFIIAVTTVCYAAVLWGLIIRTFVGLIAFVFVLQCVLPMCFAMLTVIGVDLGSGIPAYRVIITAMVMIGLAATGVWHAKRKYVALEWGTML